MSCKNSHTVDKIFASFAWGNVIGLVVFNNLENRNVWHLKIIENIAWTPQTQITLEYRTLSSRCLVV